jgi:hypothetical protein
MKGVVFTEFLEMVEERFSEEVADQIIEACELPSGGSYTAVGTYDHGEMVQLVAALSAATGAPVPDLLRAFGRHLFHRFVGIYPQLFVGVRSAFDFLRGIETHIHTEVRKLYPDAELPRLECHEPAPDRMELVYRSSRPFADLAEGLIAGCAEHFGEDVRVTREVLPATHGHAVRFTLWRGAEASRWTS